MMNWFKRLWEYLERPFRHRYMSSDQIADEHYYNMVLQKTMETGKSCMGKFDENGKFYVEVLE